MWIYGYGSLMWNPNFEYEEKIITTLHGYERSFCIKTHSHRGNAEQHGLVLGLIENSQSKCIGVAFKIKKSNIQSVIEYLDKRELDEGNYKKIIVDINHKIKNALIYVADINSSLFSALECPIQQAEIIESVKGDSGYNIDYYNSIIEMLKNAGIKYEPIFKIKEYLKKNKI